MTALVTGASRGIGFEIADLLAAEGHDLVVVARDGPALDEAAESLAARHRVRVRRVAKDLARPGAARELWSELAAEGVSVRTLVNDAGFGLCGPFADEEPDALDRMVELNVGALTALTRLALSGMLRRREGRILNVASLAGYQPGGPGMAAYYATKSYVLSFTKGLARELRGSGVSATALCPGPTRTAFEERSGAGATPLYGGPVMEARDVARAGLRGMQRGAAVVVPGLLAKLLAFAGELPPRRIALEVNRLLLRPAAR